MRPFAVVCCFCLLAFLSPLTALAHDAKTAPEAPTSVTTPGGVLLESLLRATLERVDGTEVIVSRVTMPPGAELPKHWHPGEEFAYVLEGTVALWQEGEEEFVGKAGDVVKIPLRKIHAASTSEEGATVLVFRVHEEGQPERTLVD